MHTPISEYKAVCRAVGLLGQANIDCNFDLCRGMFHKDAAITGLLNGEVSVGGVDGLDKAINSQGPLPGFVNQADILAMENGVAIVRVSEEDVCGKNYVNYLTLVKTGSDWKCVSMVYTEN